MSEFHDQIARYRAAIEALSGAVLPRASPEAPVRRHALQSACGRKTHPSGPDAGILPHLRRRLAERRTLACALEMVHTYSLIHDDLPCMDNDDYRRGRLTNHKVFGEALAVLAGDGLLTAAFETAANAPADPAVIVRAIRILSEQAGELGMVGGQVLDMQAEEQELTEQGIYDIQRRKTGALIQAACQIGVVAANGTAQQLEAAKTYAQNLGLAFQIRDDMLDVLGDADKLGKATHMDEHKNTFVRLYGIGACSKMIEAETKTAIEALGCFESSEFLVEMARQLALREY